MTNRPSLSANDFTTAMKFHQRGEFDRAEAIYRSILASEPHHFDAAHALGVLSLQRRQFRKAEQHLSLAIKINPDDAGAHNNRGYALLELERIPEAIVSYSKAIAIEPQNPGALYNRATALLRANRFEEAVVDFNKALQFAPTNAQIYNHRGIAFSKLARRDEALQSFDKAIAYQPLDPASFLNRANVLLALERHEEALASINRSIELDPSANAYFIQGSALRALKKYDLAIAAFKKAFELDPHIDFAHGNYVLYKIWACDWKHLEKDIIALVRDFQSSEIVVDPFVLFILPDTAPLRLECARRHTRKIAPSTAQSRWSGKRYAHDRIHVGYLSSDFRQHPVGYLTTGTFDAHDRNRFQVTAFSTWTSGSDEIRDRISRSCEEFLDVKDFSDDALAMMIQEREIDILVNMNGTTTYHRTELFARRPSPVQINYLGFPGTMGADYIDYIIADKTIITESDEKFYDEKVVYLPDTFLPSDSKRRIAATTMTRKDEGLPDQSFVFCCFNNSYKILPLVFDIWMRLLRDVPDSVLWLASGDEYVRANLRREAEHRGVAPNRLVFARFLERNDEHLARHALADIFLDTLPYNAHTTASDALWSGLPLLTCKGDTYAGRVSASLLHAIGLPELVTNSLQEYEALALKLAREPEPLASIKAKLAMNRTSYPLFNTERYTRHLEAAYTTMWTRFQKGQSPRSFAVNPVN